ncbi:SDR family NAD(P)-dependent oxidoreductase [Aquabacterium sp.]|uniref:SDR family NAD(P)-dependent oxidoreductase n=1 Tax=Aquabacterium sp. TaxID=1872578 RepID=UPI002C93D9A4|nr:SDR family oxidoreductase [Aquabacterium sp.]HSW04934.1 SDR family oxidoreductase [Aquabacterium sp.]
MRGIAGKVALVTGGAAGIGAAACRRLVAEGARVAIGDIDHDKAQALAAELGTDALALAFDAEDTDSIKALVDSTVAHFGRLDFLFNNAALVSREVIGQDSNPVDIDFAIWDRTMAVNARGYLAGCKYAIPHMLKTGSGGAIVMTASGSGLLGDLSNIAYAASKAAIMSMARTVATQYGKQGIRCNAINPGLIQVEARKNMPAPVVEIMLRNTLVPRLGLPEDIGGMVAFLCSDDGAFITGQAINVDGGLQSHMPYYADFASGGAKWS